ncbi:MAG: hypothetical protein IJC88_02785 [Oscillospiraceae bacterium]|nr:hypothetical protein [Oscillospiraceae bacterium]
MKWFSLLLPIFFLCGCWDYNEAAMQEYVLGIGVDLNKDESYLVTIETADLSGSPESQSKSKLLTAEGKNLFDAIRNAISHAGKKLYWGHCELIVIDDSIKNEKLHEVLDVFLRAQDVYQTVTLTVAQGASAAEVFSTDYSGSDSVTAHCLHIFQNQASSRRFQQCELWEYVQSSGDLGCVILPTISISNGMAQISGGAVYRDESLLGVLSGEEILFLSLLTEDVSGGWLPSIQVLPQTSISTEILAGTLSTTKTPTLILSVAISSSDTSFDVSDQTIRQKVEQKIEQYVNQGVNALIERAKHEEFSELLPSDFQQIKVTVRLRNSGMRTSKGAI